MSEYVSDFYLKELALIFIVVVKLCTVLSIVHYNKHWFIIDTARTDPYELVYRVTLFACQYKVSICLSAFTYSEDDTPLWLNMG